MQFQVPQFIDVEDKIIGTLTIKQFLYLAGGMGLAYLSFRFVPFLGIFLALVFAGFGAMLAFYKFNNKPFIFLLESAFNYIRGTRLYVWRRHEKKTETELDLSNFKPTKHAVRGVPLSATTSNRLNDLTWSIDMKQKEIEVQKVSGESEAIL